MLSFVPGGCQHLPYTMPSLAEEAWSQALRVAGKGGTERNVFIIVVCVTGILAMGGALPVQQEANSIRCRAHILGMVCN